MSVFKEASKQRLRISTTKGSLSVEQLWDLNLSELDELAVSLEEAHEKSGKKSFLVKKTAKDKIAKLKFDVVLEVLNSKAEDAEQARVAQENKEHNQKILSLIQDKKDETLKGKSIKELEKLLK